MSCGVGHRLGLDPELLWLCHRSVAMAPIRPLAWEPSYPAGAALKSKKKKRKERKKKKVLGVLLRQSSLRIQHCHCCSLGLCFEGGQVNQWYRTESRNRLTRQLTFLKVPKPFKVGNDSLFNKSSWDNCLKMGERSSSAHHTHGSKCTYIKVRWVTDSDEKPKYKVFRRKHRQIPLRT